MVTQQRGEITKIEADVVINAANTENKHGGGVDLTIARAAGPVYKDASNEKTAVAMGKFLVSPAGDLRAKVIIDVPTIDLVNAQSIPLDTLKQVWRDVLTYCQQHGYKTIATPLLGAGVVGYSQQQIIELLTGVGQQFTDLEIQIVIYP